MLCMLTAHHSGTRIQSSEFILCFTEFLFRGLCPLPIPNDLITQADRVITLRRAKKIVKVIIRLCNITLYTLSGIKLPPLWSSKLYAIPKTVKSERDQKNNNWFHSSSFPSTSSVKWKSGEYL